MSHYNPRTNQEEDLFKNRFYIRHAGVKVQNPYRIFLVHPESNNPTWAEKKRYSLIMKMKKRKAIYNQVLGVLTMVFLVFVILALEVFFLSFTTNQVQRIGIGIIGGYLIILSWIVIKNSFEFDSRCVNVKHRGKWVY